MIDYLKGLNPKQLEAVKCNDQNLLLIAGAGTGKTKTIVSKISYMIDNGLHSPYEIMALTFSNNAAREMRTRLATNFESEDLVRNLTISTFHSLCVRILRIYGDSISLGKNFTIYDEKESEQMLKEVYNRYDEDDDVPSMNKVAAYIEKLKNYGYYPRRKKVIKQIDNEYMHLFEEYEDKLASNNAVDFGGLITKTLELLEKNPQVKKYYNERFKYILVDEFQDTNHAQYDLIKLLKGDNTVVCATGDDDQLLFSWRHADVNIILNYDQDFSAKTIKLEQNYRSHQNILDVANNVISKNILRKGKNLWTSKTSEKKIKIVETLTSDFEGHYVVEDIKSKIQAGADPEQFVVLYRSNYQSRTIEEHCMRQNIAYRVIGGLKFFDRKEIKDILAFFKLFANRKDKLAFEKTFMQLTKKIGEKTFAKILNEIELEEDFIEGILMVSKNNKAGLSKGIITQLANYHKVMNELHEMFLNEKISKVFDKIMEQTQYIEMIKNMKEEEQYRIDNILEFKSNLVALEEKSQTDETTSLIDYIDHISLERNKNNEKGSDDKKINLMTIHASKGLEFEHVYLIGFEEGIFPSHQINSATLDEKEGERRLLYVAITRAKSDLRIVYCKERFLFGKRTWMAPSRFLRDIPMDKVNFTKITKF